MVLLTINVNPDADTSCTVGPNTVTITKGIGTIDLVAGTYNIVMPTTVTWKTASLNFWRWDGPTGPTNPTRTVTMGTTAKTLVAWYAEPTPTLTLKTNPAANATAQVDSNTVNIVNGVGSITLNAPSTVNVTVPATIAVGGVTYKFSKWGNGNTSNPRTTTVNVDMSMTAIYTTAPTFQFPLQLLIIPAVVLLAGGAYYLIKKK